MTPLFRGPKGALKNTLTTELYALWSQIPNPVSKHTVTYLYVSVVRAGRSGPLVVSWPREVKREKARRQLPLGRQDETSNESY